MADGDECMEDRLIHRAKSTELERDGKESILRVPTQQDNNSASILWNPVVLSILITETAERVAYFGFRAVLVLYFTQSLQLEDSTAVSLFAGTSGLSYFSPLLGAILADSQWGRFVTIWRFGSLYACGLYLLTWGSTMVSSGINAQEDVPNDQQQDDALGLPKVLTLVGLLFVCLGTGGIKPCVSAFGADQVVLGDHSSRNYTGDAASDDEDEVCAPLSQQDDKIREFFNSFYFCINVGALLSFAVIPIIRAHWGFSAAFGIPTVAMTLAMLVFRSQKHRYKHRQLHSPSVANGREAEEPAAGSSLLDVFCVALSIIQADLWYSATRLWHRLMCRASPSDPPLRSDALVLTASNSNSHPTEKAHEIEGEHGYRQQVYGDASQALHLLPLLAFFPIFWTLYDQQGSVWTLQATRLQLHGLQPEQLQFLNPLLIMIFIPLFEKGVYPWLEHRHFNIQPVRRMQWGMFLTAISFLMSTALERRIQSHAQNTVSVTWQIPQITVLTVAEILLNVTGLEFAYSQAPPAMQALILALYLLMTAIGDGLGAMLYASVFADMDPDMAMLICAIAMMVNLFFFSRVANGWVPYHQHRQSLAAHRTDDGLELGPM
eukprot:Nitzschia sp. Nitz4//scaffold75_size92586//58790//60604//NITZ4_004861-RA/size92586-processed-gene-0.24-mRNA-1//1//CDS//3329557723//545//frame0